MFGLSEEYDTLGHVRVTYVGHHRYSIDNTFEDIGSEKVFFFYLVDKVMADMDTRENVERALGQIHSYLHDQFDAVDKMEEEFYHFEEAESESDNYEFTIKQELRRKEDNEVDHLYVNTYLDPKIKSDTYTRLVNSAILYMMDLHDRASETDLWRYGNRYSDMLRYYDDHGYPSATTVTISDHSNKRSTPRCVRQRDKQCRRSQYVSKALRPPGRSFLRFVFFLLGLTGR